MEISNSVDREIRPILKGKNFLVSGDADVKVEARSDNDVTTSELGKIPPVTDVAVRGADPAVSHTTSAGWSATFVFCIVILKREKQTFIFINIFILLHSTQLSFCYVLHFTLSRHVSATGTRSSSG